MRFATTTPLRACFLATLTLIAGMCIFTPLHARGQTDTNAVLREPGTTDSLDATYLTELRKIHLPLISAYVVELQRLEAQSATQDEAVAIHKELERTQRFITRSGIVPLKEAKRLSLDPDADMPVPEPAPTPRELTDAMLVLLPTLAGKIDPPVSDASSSEAVPVHEISWTVEAIPAGVYEVILQYAMPEPAETLTTLSLDFDHSELELPLTESDTTGSGDDYRLMKLGRVVLNNDLKNESLTLRVSPSLASAPILHLRQLLLTKIVVKPPSNAE